MYDPRYSDELFRPSGWDDYYRLERLRRMQQDAEQERRLRELQEAEQRRLLTEAQRENDQWKKAQGVDLKNADWGGILSQLGGMMGGGQQQSAAPMPSAPSVPIPTAQITTRPMEAVWEGYDEPLLARLLGVSRQR
jgi:hypothetical protein